MKNVDVFQIARRVSLNAPFVISTIEGEVDVDRLTEVEGRLVAVPKFPVTCAPPSERLYSVEEVIGALGDLVKGSVIRNRLEE